MVIKLRREIDGRDIQHEYVNQKCIANFDRGNSKENTVEY
jgi:hypothetical protein